MRQRFQRLRKTCIDSVCKNVRGAVLLEFTCCLSVFILLLFGLHDIFKISRTQDRMRLVSHEITSMLQNATYGSTTQSLTTSNISQIVRAAYLSVFPNLSASHQFSPNVIITCLKSSTQNEATCLWKYEIRESSGTFYVTAGDGTYGSYGNVDIQKNATKSLSDIYPPLKMNIGETKVLVDSSLSYSGAQSNTKSSFGLNLLSPPYAKFKLSSGTLTTSCYHSVSIFTPKPGLFSGL